MAGTNLFSLPGELRNKIWRQIVISSAPINVEPLCEVNNRTLHQPAVAFTCKALREEVLSIFYAENTFYLGKIGYHDPKDIRLYDFNIRLSRWQALLGGYTRYLTRLTMDIDGRCYAWDAGMLGDAKYEMMADKADSIRFLMNAQPRCTCRLKPGVVQSATRDGRILLEVMQEYSASYCEAVREGRCDKCGLSRLEKFGSTEVTHQKNWDDIVTS